MWTEESLIIMCVRHERAMCKCNSQSVAYLKEQLYQLTHIHPRSAWESEMKLKMVMDMGEGLSS